MDFRERIVQGRENLADAQAANDNTDREFESEYYGIENIRNPLACIDLRFADGNRKAIPYSDFSEINFDPSDGIEIITADKKITITGRDLERLYDYLVAYRVRYVAEGVGSTLNDSFCINLIMIE